MGPGAAPLNPARTTGATPAAVRTALSDRTARLVSRILTRLAAWAARRADLGAAAVVGSFARGTPHEGSDLDVILLADSPSRLLRSRSWIRAFGPVRSIRPEDWGEVTSLRVVFRTGLEVEFGLAPVSWARLPPDEGTRAVVQDGLRIMHDPRGLLGRLQAAIDAAMPGRARGSAAASAWTHPALPAGSPVHHGRVPGEPASGSPSMPHALLAWLRDSALDAAWAPGLVFAIFLLSAGCLRLFAVFPRLDAVLHFAGGLAISHFFYRACRTAGRHAILDVHGNAALGTLAISLTSLAAVAWEIAEFVLDHLMGTGLQISLADTMQDLILGLLGSAGYVGLRAIVVRARRA